MFQSTSFAGCLSALHSRILIDYERGCMTLAALSMAAVSEFHSGTHGHFATFDTMPSFKDSPLSLPVLMQVRTWHAVTLHKKGSGRPYMHCLGCSVGGFAIVVDRFTASNHHPTGDAGWSRLKTECQGVMQRRAKMGLNPNIPTTASPQFVNLVDESHEETEAIDEEYHSDNDMEPIVPRAQMMTMKTYDLCQSGKVVTRHEWCRTTWADPTACACDNSKEYALQLRKNLQPPPAKRARTMTPPSPRGKGSGKRAFIDQNCLSRSYNIGRATSQATRHLRRAQSCQTKG
eukprot:6490662-Amphidinium_carterae.4